MIVYDNEPELNSNGWWMWLIVGLYSMDVTEISFFIWRPLFGHESVRQVVRDCYL